MKEAEEKDKAEHILEARTDVCDRARKETMISRNSRNAIVMQMI